MAKVPEGFELVGIPMLVLMPLLPTKGVGFYGVQFHPEVNHTEHGVDMIRNFLNVCGAKGEWTMGDFCKRTVAGLKERNRHRQGAFWRCQVGWIPPFWPRFWPKP